MTTDEPNLPTTDDGPRLVLAEEVATVSTVDRVTGRVRVSTEVEVTEQLVRARLEGEAVEVTRVAVNRTVDSAPPVRVEGEVTIVPVLEEVLVVEKRLVLKEELHIRRRRTVEAVEQTVTLRKERAVIERFDAQGRPLGEPAA